MSNPIDSFVQIATDGQGKRMRNLLRYTAQADGTVVPVYEEVVQIADPAGNPVDFTRELSDLNEAVQNLAEVLSETTSGDAFKGMQRVWGMSSLPSKAGQFNPINAMGDMFGRQVTLPLATRDMVLTQGTTISASTSETTIATGGSGFFLDLVLLIISNTSTSTSTRIDIRDVTAGTVLFSLQSVGGANPVGFALPVPIPQTKINGNWTAQCGTSTTDIRVYGVWVKNQ